MKKKQQNKDKDYKITFVKKLFLVTSVRKTTNYLLLAFLIMTLSTLLIVSGFFAEGYLWLGVLLYIISLIIALAIIIYGVNNVWNDMFK